MTFTLKNTGSVAGADAVQVYVGPPSDSPAGIQFAVRSLAQFDRVELSPGQSKDGDAPRSGASALVLVGSEAAVGARLRRPRAVGRRRRRARRACRCGRRSWRGERERHVLERAAQRDDDQRQPDRAEGQLVRSRRRDGERQPAADERQRRAARGLDRHRQPAAHQHGRRRGRDELGRERGLQQPRSRGNLQITGSAAGSPWHIGACGPNTVGGNLQFTNNAGTGNTISRTTAVHGNLQCTGNHDVTGQRQHGQREPPGAVRGL